MHICLFKLCNKGASHTYFLSFNLWWRWPYFVKTCIPYLFKCLTVNVCNPDMFPLNWFLTFKHRYTKVALTYKPVRVFVIVIKRIIKIPGKISFKKESFLFTFCTSNVFFSVISKINNVHDVLHLIWEWSVDKEIRQWVDCLVAKGKAGVEKKDCNFNKIVQWEYRQVKKAFRKTIENVLIFEKKNINPTRCCSENMPFLVINQNHLPVFFYF